MKKVILVDDHIMFREGLANILKSQADFQVIGQAGTAQEAVELVRKLSPDLVLMDFGLPDASGIEATQNIMAEKPNTIIIFLTVYDTDQILFAAIRSGAKGYLLKSQSSAQLLESLRAIEKGEVAISLAMVKDILDEFTRQGTPSDASHSKLSKLTLREFEILKELTSGSSNLEIAQHLSISENTVKNQIHGILTKLNVKNRHEAIWFARQHGIGDPPGNDGPNPFEKQQKRMKD
jgi:two-component system NarL family response regulator